MIEGYAQFLIEFTRERLGYDGDDSSHDDEVLLKLQSGEKLSKSKHMQMSDMFPIDKVVSGELTMAELSKHFKKAVDESIQDIITVTGEDNEV